MGIEDLQNPPPSGVINRAPLHRHEPGITQMANLGERLNLPGAIAAKYQRTAQTSSFQTLGHRLQRKEAIGPADGELVKAFDQRSASPIPEPSVQTPQLSRQAEVAVPSPVQETPTQTFRIRRSPQGAIASQPIAMAVASSPLNPPSLGDFEPSTTARFPQTWGLGGDPPPIQTINSETTIARQPETPNPQTLESPKLYRISRSPQPTLTQTETLPIAQPNPAQTESLPVVSSVLSPVVQTQAETIVQRKVKTAAQTEVQTAAPTKAETTIYKQTNIQRSPTPQLQLHRPPQVNEIQRHPTNASSEVLQPITTTQSETGAIQRHIESSPLVLHSQAIAQPIAQRVIINEAPQTLPSEQRIAPSDRSSDSAQSPDITGLVDHISRIMARQLAVERERRGL